MKRFKPLSGRAMTSLPDFALIAVTACAQNPATTGTTSDTMESSATTQQAKLVRADFDMMKDLAQANIAEIETGRLAREKAQKDQVRRFGAATVADHTKALEELQSLATRKGVTVGVADQTNTHELLERVRHEAKAPELRAYAAKTLPIVHADSVVAQQVHRQNLMPGAARTYSGAPHRVNEQIPYPRHGCAREPQAR